MKYEGEVLSVFFAVSLMLVGHAATDDDRALPKLIVVPADAPVDACVTHYCGRDYPAAALRERRQGLVSASVGANAEGRPERCWVTVPSGDPVLDDATCPLLMARGPYAPGRAVNGSPRRVRADYDVDWRLDATISSDRHRLPPNVPVTRERRNRVG